MLPGLFISHGSPVLALTPTPARNFLLGLGHRVKTEWQRPRALGCLGALGNGGPFG